MPGYRRLRLLVVVGRRRDVERQQGAMYGALERQFEVRTHFVDDGWPERFRDLTQDFQADACLWRVKFRELLERPAFEWDGFDGPRIMYDPDVVQNYIPFRTRRYLGQWPAVFRANRFDWLVSTSDRVTRRLVEEGVAARWLPKAVDGSLLRDLGRRREGLAYFGVEYLARRRVLRLLEGDGVPIERFRCEYSELNEHLNRYTGILLNNQGWQNWPLVGGPMRRVAPSWSGRPIDGLEPMAKNFEVAAAGCLGLTDWVPDLDPLGFKDGVNVLVYRSRDELTDRARRIAEAPEDLELVRRAGAQLVHERHTWDERARTLQAWIEQA